MDINIIGFNDCSTHVPNFFKTIKDSDVSIYLAMYELPKGNNQTRASDFSNAQLFSYFNNKANYKNEKIFINKTNSLLEEVLGSEQARVNDSVLKSVYLLKDNFEFLYPVGSLKSSRYERSVDITNNIIEVLNPLLKSKAEYSKNVSLNLRDSYKQGNKVRIIETLLSSLEDLDSPKNAMNSLIDKYDLTFKHCESEDVVYVNPHTFRNVFNKVKKEGFNEQVYIFVGEPHRLFIEYFLKERYESVSSACESIFETCEETDFVIKDIQKAITTDSIFS